MINLSVNKWVNKGMKNRIMFHTEALMEDVIIDDVISFCSDKCVRTSQSEEEALNAGVPAALLWSSGLFKFKPVNHFFMQIFKDSL